MQTPSKSKLHPAAQRRDAAGFTLIELLTVIAIIGILAAILIPVAGAARERTRRAVCLSNIRQQIVAMQMYADDHNGNGYWDMSKPANDDAPADLYPDYADITDIFICPSTKNVIRQNLVAKGIYWDLNTNAPKGREDSSGGHSYEYFGFYGNLGFFQGLSQEERKKAPNNVPDGFLAETVLVVDSDDGNPGTNNCPDMNNNHERDGWSWGFADGHVEWVTREQTSARFERSFHADGCP